MNAVQVQAQQRRFNSMEQRPRMLKDFLSENSNSSSSGGFKSLPRKPIDPNSSTTAATSITMTRNSNSPFQTLVNAVKTISFFSVLRKSPSVILPRSLSRKLSSSRSRRNSSRQKENETKITVKIKDIIRWKSFRDLVTEEHQPPSPPPPLDFHRYTTATATTGSSTTTNTTCSSSNSSWSDGDFFTYGYSVPSWNAQNDVEEGKKFTPLAVGMDLVEPITGKAVGAKEVLTCQEEQQSPVSVLQVREDEFSPFDQSLANIERRKQKFMQTVQRSESLAKYDFANLDQCPSLDENSGLDEEYDNEVEERDWVEERARQLLHFVKATGSVQSCKAHLDKLLLDFFREELSERRNQTKNDDKSEREILRVAEDWVNGSFAYNTENDNKDAYIKDMDKGEVEQV